MPADIADIMKRVHDSEPSWWPYGLKRSMLDKAWLITDPATGQKVGFSGWQFRQQDGQKMAFYAVGVLPEFRRKGLAKRALTEMFDRHLPADVAGVRAFIVPSNAPSLSLAAKLGVQVQHKAASLRAVSQASKVGAMKLARNMPTGYNGVSLQQYMPLVARRPVLQPAEQDAIAEGKSQWLPQIFTSMADSPAVDMHSPGKGALMASLLGAAAAGGGAHMLGASPQVTGAVAGGGGLMAALAAYYSSKANNDGIEEMMRRIPAGGTRRDMLADPVLQAERERDSRGAVSTEGLRTAQMLAALQAVKQSHVPSGEKRSTAFLARAGKNILGALKHPNGAAPLGTLAYDALTVRPHEGQSYGDAYMHNNVGDRSRMAALNWLILRGSGMAAKGVTNSALSMAGKPLLSNAGSRAVANAAMIPAVGGLVVKDLGFNNLHTGSRIAGALESKGAPASAAPATPAGPNSLETAVQLAKEHPWLTGAAALTGLGAVAGGGLMVRDGIKSLVSQSDREEQGRIRVTLPTRKPGDAETTLDMPARQIELSDAMFGRIRRDVKRRLNQETSERTMKRTLSEEERARRAALLASYR